MGSRRFFIVFALLVSLLSIAPAAQQSSGGGIASIQQGLLKEWLTYIASDELQGRATYSEGLGLAAMLWLGFPAVLLTGSMLWERTPLVTAALHAGDWLLKLVLVAVVLGLFH